MTVKACKNILTTLILEKKINDLQPVISSCVQLLGPLLEQQNIDLLLLLFSCLTDIINVHKMEPQDVLLSFHYSLLVSSPLSLILRL